MEKWFMGQIRTCRLLVSIKRTGAYNAPPFPQKKYGETDSSYL
jgi:hypothetical protein